MFFGKFDEELGIKSLKPRKKKQSCHIASRKFIPRKENHMLLLCASETFYTTWKFLFSLSWFWCTCHLHSYGIFSIDCKLLNDIQKEHTIFWRNRGYFLPKKVSAYQQAPKITKHLFTSVVLTTSLMNFNLVHNENCFWNLRHYVAGAFTWEQKSVSDQLSINFFLAHKLAEEF